MISYVLYFETSMLIPHFKEEEDCLFIHDKGPLVQQAISEHKQILQLIDNFRQAPDSVQHSDLAVLADLLDHHVRFEERELFAYLETQLSTEQLAAVLQCTENGPAVIDDFQDAFWQEKKGSA